MFSSFSIFTNKKIKSQLAVNQQIKTKNINGVIKNTTQK